MSHNIDNIIILVWHNASSLHCAVWPELWRYLEAAFMETLTSTHTGQTSSVERNVPDDPGKSVEVMERVSRWIIGTLPCWPLSPLWPRWPLTSYTSIGDPAHCQDTPSCHPPQWEAGGGANVSHSLWAWSTSKHRQSSWILQTSFVYTALPAMAGGSCEHRMWHISSTPHFSLCLTFTILSLSI